MLSVVGEVPDGAPRTVAGLDELLLEAKLSVPGPRPGLVSRSGLVESVRERVPGGGCDGAGRLREVDPAGAVGTRRGPAGGLGVSTASTTTPAGLLRLLAAAYAGVTPGCAGLVADMRAVGASVLARAAPRLASALRTSPAPFVLMLDLARAHRTMGEHATARHLLREVDDVLRHQPALGTLVDEAAETPPGPRDGRAVGSGQWDAADAGRASAAAAPAYAPDDPRDRRAAVRLPQHGQHRGRLDLPETRCGRSRAPAPASAPPRPRGSPTTGMTPTSTSTISVAVAPTLTADLGSVRRDRSPDRHQRGKAHEFQRLRIEHHRPGVHRFDGAFREAHVIEPEGAQSIRVVDAGQSLHINAVRRDHRHVVPGRAVQRPNSPSSATHPVGARTGTGASRRSCEPGHRPAAAGELHPLHMTTEAGPRGTVTDGDPGATPAHRSDLGADPAGPITEETRHVRLATRTEC
jgi:hypothetical protein